MIHKLTPTVLALTLVCLGSASLAQAADASKKTASVALTTNPKGQAESVSDALKKGTAGGVFVRVNGHAISRLQFDTALRIAMAQGAADSPELRSTLRAQMIAQELMRQEALKLNLQNDPAVIAAREQAGMLAMMQRYVSTTARPTVVTEEAVHKRYEEVVASLGEQEYKSRAIAVDSEATAQEALARLRKQEGSFDEIARKYSVLPSASAGGQMDWVSFKQPLKEGHTQGIPLPMANALVALKPGSVLAEPIAYDGKFYIVGLDQVRPTQVPKYDDVKDALRKALESQAAEKATAALISRLINSARIE